MTAWIAWRWRVACLRHRERRLAWQTSLWPDEDLTQLLEFVRFARRQAEIGVPSYPPTRDGSR